MWYKLNSKKQICPHERDTHIMITTNILLIQLYVNQYVEMSTKMTTIILRFGEIWLCPQFCSISVWLFWEFGRIKTEKVLFFQASFWCLSHGFYNEISLSNLQRDWRTLHLLIFFVVFVLFPSLVCYGGFFYPPCSPLYLSFWTGSPMHEAPTIVGFGEGQIYRVLPLCQRIGCLCN